ncbi:MAG TPA: beta-ketoacyl-[acyl-carrier-protein] synthase II [Phycisphaerales bacterium]|nr:beta-ketoacyl-[acyl-carrier-protein] synthase II [Phycisphaerales bacterium]|tara:strand:+ start:64219 stop:65511 length:1293 start_codon:yes stop_codon:yes gene_type:complete
MTKRVVITGIGWVTPMGADIESVWAGLLAGKSAIGPTTHFDASTFPTKFCGQVADSYTHNDHVTHKHLHEGVGANTSFALGAASQAWKSAGLDQFAELDPTRLGIYLGSGEGSLDFENYAASALAGWDEDARGIDAVKWAAKAQQCMSAICEIEQEPNMPLTHLALEFNAQGPAYNCLTACAASTQAIGEATEILRRGQADVMISGGAHTMIHPLGVTGFNRLTALSTRNDSPSTASRPFSADRDGFVMGEGSGMLILETLEHAQKRGATILAEITGYGSSADAFRVTDMHPEGMGAYAAMKQALDQANVTTADIDYISAHGTSTKENDSTESMAIGSLFAEHAKTTPVSSIKSMLGHLIAAAGSVEAIVCVLALRDQTVPPTINYGKPDPECTLDYIPNESRKLPVDICLSNSFGFGGQNDTLVIRKFQ